MDAAASVIVPVYEQWHLVPALLACLSRQTVPAGRFEVILVDNGSARFDPPALLPPNARIERCPETGSYAARNAGAAMAGAAWLVFTDADCLPDPGWLAALLDAAAEPARRRTLLVGDVEVRPASGRPNAVEIYDMVKGIPQQRYARRGYGATANLAVAAALFGELGGFDAKRLSGGDADFCRRAVAAGASVLFVPAARVGHPARDDWNAIATKARRVLGGQLTNGPAGRRAYWALRTLLAPLVEGWRFARDRRHPAGYRLVALGVQLRLWGPSLAEMLRLALGGSPERR